MDLSNLYFSRSSSMQAGNGGDREDFFKRKGINFSTTTSEGRILRSAQVCGDGWLWSFCTYVLSMCKLHCTSIIPDNVSFMFRKLIVGKVPGSWSIGNPGLRGNLLLSLHLRHRNPQICLDQRRQSKYHRKFWITMMTRIIFLVRLLTSLCRDEKS